MTHADMYIYSYILVTVPGSTRWNFVEGSGWLEPWMGRDSFYFMHLGFVMV